MTNTRQGRPLKRGDLVRMMHQYKFQMNAQVLPGVRKNPKKPHPLVKEFGRCTGVVQGLVNYGNQQGPEYDVRWKPSGLRYAYAQEELQIVRRS